MKPDQTISDETLKLKIEVDLLWITHNLTESERESLEDQVFNLVKDGKYARPHHIMGKSLEEVCQILAGLELEKETGIKMVMSNLETYMKLLREDLTKATQRATENMVNSTLKRVANGEISFNHIGRKKEI